MVHPHRRLLLLRHAKSSWKEAGLADRERPLNKRGRRACKLLRINLAELGLRPGLILCSPARRTVETLERIAPALGEGTETRYEERLYDASAAGLLELLRETDDDVGELLLVGHNPGIAELAAMLASEGAELARMRAKYPTGALAVLGLVGSWAGLARGAATLDTFWRPREPQRGRR
jgi:phosphohistidine phosphatase